MGFVMFGYINL